MYWNELSHNNVSSKSLQSVGHILISPSLLLLVLLCYSDASRLDRAWIEPPEMTKVSVCWCLQFAETPGNLLKKSKGILKTEKNHISCHTLLSTSVSTWWWTCFLRVLYCALKSIEKYEGVQRTCCKQQRLGVNIIPTIQSLSRSEFVKTLYALCLLCTFLFKSMCQNDRLNCHYLAKDKWFQGVSSRKVLLHFF